MIHIVDHARLLAYRQLLAEPDDQSVQGRRGHHITAPAAASLDIERLEAKFVRHLMYRQLERDGDL